MPNDIVDPYVADANRRGDEAWALFEDLERRRKEAMEQRANPKAQPSITQTPQIPGTAPTNQELAKPFAGTEPIQSTAKADTEKLLKGSTVTWEDDLQDIQKAIDKGDFNVAQQMAAYIDEKGGAANIPSWMIAKMQTANYYDKTKGFSPVRAAKSTGRAVVDTTKELGKAFLWELPKAGIASEFALRKMAAAKLTGDQKEFDEAKADALKQYLQFESGAEVGFFGAADLARRAFRKKVSEPLREATQAAKEGDLKGLAVQAVKGVPGVGQMMAPVAEAAGALPTKSVADLTDEDRKRMDEELWRDAAVQQQLMRTARGEGAYLEQAAGATAKDIAKAHGRELEEGAISAWSTINNPYIGFGPASKLVQEWGLFGRAIPKKVPGVRPTPKGPTPKPVAGKVIEQTGSAIEASGAGALRQAAGGATIFSAISGNPFAAVASAVTPWAIRKIGGVVRRHGQKVAAGESPVVAAPKIARVVNDNLVKPYWQGAKGTAMHPSTVGLTLFTENDEDAGAVLGGAMAFGGVLNTGIRAGLNTVRGAHSFAARDLVNQNKVRQEPFDPEFGEFASTTEQNLRNMDPVDQSVINSIRNNVRKVNITEPDIAGIKAAKEPPRMGKEVIVDCNTAGDGSVYYETSTGRKVGPVEAGRIAYEAGQPLRDVTYDAEVVVGGPADSQNPAIKETLGENAYGNRGFASASRHGDAGKINIWLNKDAFSAYHEASHVLDWARHPAERARQRQMILDTYGPETVEGFRRYYGEMLAGREIAKLTELLRSEGLAKEEARAIRGQIERLTKNRGWAPDPEIDPIDPGSEHIVGDAGQNRWVVRDGQGQTRIVDFEEGVRIGTKQGQTLTSEKLALDEAAAEMGSMALKTRSLQGVPDSMRQIAARNAMIFLEATGAVKPGAAFGRTAMDDPGSALGFEASGLADDVFWRGLMDAAHPVQKPGAPVGGPTAPEFFTGQQRFAGRELAPDVLATEQPVVSPRPPVSPGGEVTPTGKTPVRPGIVNVERNTTTVDTTKGATPGEIESIVNGLREGGVPEDVLAQVRTVLEAKDGPVELTYASATPEGLPPSEARAPRREEQRITYLREEGAINAELQKMSEETRTKFTREFLPNRIIVRHGRGGEVQVNFEGLSPSKLLQNAIILDRAVERINGKLTDPKQRMALPYQDRAGRFGRFDYDTMWRDLERYTENQANGYTGTGERLVRPEGFIEFTPPENPNFTPHQLDPVKASFFNMLHGVEPPRSTKSTKRIGVKTPEGQVKAVARGVTPDPSLAQVEVQPKHVSAYQLSEANAPGRGVTSVTRETGVTGPRTAPAKPWEVDVPTTKVRKGMPATQVKKGTFKDPVSGKEFDIQEFNLLRDEVTQKARSAGEKDFSLDNLLAEAFEELSAELVTDIKPAKGAIKYPSQTMVEAGFLPERGIGTDLLRGRDQEALREWRITPEGDLWTSNAGRVRRNESWLKPEDQDVRVIDTPDNLIVQHMKPLTATQKQQVSALAKEAGKPVMLDDVSKPVSRLRPEASFLPEGASETMRARERAKKEQLRRGEATMMGPVDRTKAEPYSAKTEAGKAAERVGVKFKNIENDAGFGYMGLEKDGAKVADLLYQTREAIDGSGDLDTHVQYIEVKPEWRGAKGKFDGKNSLSMVLYRELAERAKTQGSLRLSGDPISEAAVKVRMKVFDTTQVNDPAFGDVMVKPENLRAAVEEAGSITKFMDQQGIFELTSFFNENTRFMPKDAEYPVTAAVESTKGDRYEGRMHLFAYMKGSDAGHTNFEGWKEGFVTNKGRFVSREEGAKLAEEAYGVASENGLLTSEQLAGMQAKVNPDLLQGDTLAPELKKGGWAIITATQEAIGPASDPVNVNANKALKADIIEAGGKVIEATGVYKGEEQGKSFFVTGLKPEKLAELARTYNQESILTNKGLEYTEGGKIDKATGEIKTGDAALAQDFHTKLPNGEAFAMDIAFMPRERKQDWALPKMKPGAREAKVWIMPDGSPIQLGSKWHAQYLNENAADLSKRFRMDQKLLGKGEDASRVEAVRKGAIRINYNHGSGELTIEATKRGWEANKPAIERFVLENLDKIDSADVTIFDPALKRIVDSESAQLFRYDGKEKFENFPLLGKDVRASGSVRERISSVDTAAMPGEFNKPKGWDEALKKAKEGGFVDIHWWTENRKQMNYDNDPNSPHLGDKTDISPLHSRNIPGMRVDYYDRQVQVINPEAFRKNPKLIEQVRAASRELGLDITKLNGDPLEGDLAHRFYGSEALTAEAAKAEFGERITAEPSDPYPTFVGEGEAPVADSQHPHSPAWLLRNGKSQAVTTHDFYHDDAVHGFKEFNRPENRKLIGERAVARFQEDTGAVRLATFASLRHLGDYGGSTLGVSTAKVPSEAQLSAIRERLTDKNYDGDNTFGAVNAEFQTANGATFASLSRDIRTPADIRAVMQFLRDPFSSPDATFTKGAPAENTDGPRFMPDADLFGVVDKPKYEAGKIKKMNQRELRAHFPEAIVPRNAKDMYNYEIGKAPLLKGAKTREEQVGRYADELVKFYESVKDQEYVQSGAKWYSDLVPQLKKKFGKDAPLFTQLLAATSPQTSPKQNFEYALHAYMAHKDGTLAPKVEGFIKGLEHVESGAWKDLYAEAVKNGAKRTGTKEPTPAEFMAWWIDEHNLKPVRPNGKLFGAQSVAILRVLSGEWAKLNRGPKTTTFQSNLLGKGHEATIDLWAARTMRRLGYQGKGGRWRILPKHERAVTDPDFKLSQEAFRAAADRLGMKPDALQGALWFAEKVLYSENGWGRLDYGDYRTEMKDFEAIQKKYSELAPEEPQGAQEDLFQ